MRSRVAVWGLIAAAVVLATRALAYALEPSQTVVAQRFAQRLGGPDLTGALVGAVVVGAALAGAVLWLATVAVRERLALERREPVSRPRLDPARLVARAVLLFAVTSLGFALLESYIHWRAGLGWHGLECLTGPVHRDAIPIIGALCLVAVASHGAVEHLLAWARRLVAVLVARRFSVRNRLVLHAHVAPALSRLADLAVAPRGPPPFFVPVHSLMKGARRNEGQSTRRDVSRGTRGRHVCLGAPPY